jgi:hypothetical protein
MSTQNPCLYCGLGNNEKPCSEENLCLARRHYNRKAIECCREKDTFEVSFVCNNCGNKWVMQFPAFTRVEADGVFYPKVRIVEAIDIPRAEIHGNVRFLDCPVCGIKNGITITDRKPIEKEKAL